MSEVWSLLTRRPDRDRPLVTWIDGDLRVELSAATMTNAIAKVANALTLDLDAGPRVSLALPWHWQLPVWQGGVWVSGRTITAPEEADLRVVAEDATDAPAGCWAVSLHPWGMAITSPLPPGVQDVTDLVRAQPDGLVMPSPDSAAPTAQARDLARDLGLAPGHRLLALPANPLVPLLVPLVSGASVVMASSADEVDTERERISHIYAA